MIKDGVEPINLPLPCRQFNRSAIRTCVYMFIQYELSNTRHLLIFSRYQLSNNKKNANL